MALKATILALIGGFEGGYWEGAVDVKRVIGGASGSHSATHPELRTVINNVT